MTESDMREFVGLLAETATVFGTPRPSPMVVNVYFRTLRDFDIGEVRRAFSDHIRSSRFFPRPCELVEQIAGTAEDRGRSAWQEVLKTLERDGSYASVRFSSPLIHWALVRMGGWTRLGAMTAKDEPFREKDFINWYGKAERLGLTWADVPNRLPGRIELNNRMRGVDADRLGLNSVYLGQVIDVGKNPLPPALDPALDF